MRTRIVRIGRPQGIRIAKHLLERTGVARGGRDRGGRELSCDPPLDKPSGRLEGGLSGHGACGRRRDARPRSCRESLGRGTEVMSSTAFAYKELVHVAKDAGVITRLFHAQGTTDMTSFSPELWSASDDRVMIDLIPRGKDSEDSLSRGNPVRRDRQFQRLLGRHSLGRFPLTPA